MGLTTMGLTGIAACASARKKRPARFGALANSVASHARPTNSENKKELGSCRVPDRCVPNDSN